MNPQLDMLHDIEGLDVISFWPLALGWWVALIAILALAYYIYRKIAFMRSWKYDTLKKLSHLEKQLSEANAKKITVLLSEYLRRIALKRFSRKKCAGLVGEQWLKWLKEHDPKKFDWEKKAGVLIKAPYAPETTPLSIDLIKDLIHATRQWVR